jgi:hypothetical protein
VFTAKKVKALLLRLSSRPSVKFNNIRVVKYNKRKKKRMQIYHLKKI